MIQRLGMVGDYWAVDIMNTTDLMISNGQLKTNGYLVPDRVIQERPVMELPLPASGEPNGVHSGKSWGKRFALSAAVMAGVLGLAAGGHHWLTVGRYVESTDDAYVGGDLTVMAPRVSGFISQIAVADNQAVRAGDLLVKLDDRDYRAALAKAEASVALQQAALGSLAATKHLQESIIGQANAAVAAADAEITRTRDDHARFSQLLTGGAISVQDAQRADAAYKEAQANGEKARAGLAAAQRQIGVLDAQEQQIRAALAQAGAERDLALLNVGYTEIRAPMDGTVGNRSAQTGAFAATGSQLIALIPAHGLWVDANLKESQLAHVRPGTPATIEVDSIPGKTFHGHVVSIAPATGSRFSILPPENATGNFTKIVQRVPVRIELNDESEAGGQLRPGLSVIVKVNTAEGSSQTVGGSL